jgi:hypothetical protein
LQPATPHFVIPAVAIAEIHMKDNISKEDIVVFVGLGGLAVWTYLFLPLVFFHG